MSRSTARASSADAPRQTSAGRQRQSQVAALALIVVLIRSTQDEVRLYPARHQPLPPKAVAEN
ncbi:MAG TPA: hypothetical protein VFA03_05885 [Acetobacteraceae bacterium]|nr:hypothetical protein [Acetobacteraceae bacterium]